MCLRPVQGVGCFLYMMIIMNGLIIIHDVRDLQVFIIATTPGALLTVGVDDCGVPGPEPPVVCEHGPVQYGLGVVVAVLKRA